MAQKPYTKNEHDLFCAKHDVMRNDLGCEFGRSDATRLDTLEADYKSELISVKAGQKLFVEDIFPQMKDDVKEAGAHVKIALETVAEMKKNNSLLIYTIIGAVMVQLWVGVMKLRQDAENQTQLIKMLTSNKFKIDEVQK